MIQSYSDRRLEALACDFWNGSEAQCDLFQSAAVVSFPVLQQCSGLGAANMSACSHDYMFVVDHTGIVRYHGNTIAAANVIVDQALDALEAELVGVDDAPPASGCRAGRTSRGCAAVGWNRPGWFRSSSDMKRPVKR